MGSSLFLKHCSYCSVIDLDSTIELDLYLRMFQMCTKHCLNRCQSRVEVLVRHFFLFWAWLSSH